MSARGRTAEAGFVLLVMLGVIAAGSLGLVYVVGSLVPPLADAQRRAEDGLEAAATAARAAFRRTGAFPADLDALATAASGRTSAPWRRDPWDPARDLDYALAGADLRVAGRGPDRRPGTADDVGVVVPAEPLVRARQRSRLRLIRAVLARSPYRFAATMSAAERADMRAALRDYAVARRQWLSADAAARPGLQARLDAAAATVAALALAHALPALPASVTGAGGLMEMLGMPDALAVDGAGAALLADATVGVVARGADAMGGTDDDM